MTASDLTPELLEIGQSLAQRAGVTLDWREADAEALPFADGEFDAVLSCVGVMFAPHHQSSADELVRVCRPGGTIGLVNWTPEGFIGQLFATMKPYAPPPPPGAQPPPLWGNEDHVRALLGDRVTDVVARRESVRVTAFAAPEEFRDYFKANYGPTIAVYRNIADDPDQVVTLDRDLLDLARRNNVGGETTVLDWEYLLAHRPPSVAIGTGGQAMKAKAEVGRVETDEVTVAVGPPARGEVVAKAAHRPLLGFRPDFGPHRQSAADMLVQVRLGPAPEGLEEAVRAVPRDEHRHRAGSDRVGQFGQRGPADDEGPPTSGR